MTAPTKAERVYAVVRDDIVAGLLEAGTVLDEVALADQHQVSRTPVREALRRLTADGLVTTGARRQLVVVDLSPQHRDEITVLRTVLEGAAAEAACREVTDADLDGLQLILIRQSRHAEAEDSDAFLAEDENFHRALADIARLPTLSRFLEQLGAFVRLARLGVTTDRGHMRGLVREHEELLELLAKGHGGRLRTALEGHIRNTAGRS